MFVLPSIRPEISELTSNFTVQSAVCHPWRRPPACFADRMIGWRPEMGKKPARVRDRHAPLQTRCH
jgi:hypothetical protein